MTAYATYFPNLIAVNSNGDCNNYHIIILTKDYRHQRLSTTFVFY